MLSTAPRDPAALPRLLITALALLLLWPGLSLSELDLAVLIDGDNTRAMGNFLAGFWPPAHDGEFLALLGRAAVSFRLTCLMRSGAGSSSLSGRRRCGHGCHSGCPR